MMLWMKQQTNSNMVRCMNDSYRPYTVQAIGISVDLKGSSSFSSVHQYMPVFNYQLQEVMDMILCIFFLKSNADKFVQHSFFLTSITAYLPLCFHRGVCPGCQIPSPTCLPSWSLLFHAVFYWTTKSDCRCIQKLANFSHVNELDHPAEYLP